MDFDELDFEKPNNDLFHSVAAIYDNASIKVAFILFIAYVILNTDIFAERALRKIRPDAYDVANDKITPIGICTTGMILSMVYIIIDLLVKGDII